MSAPLVAPLARRRTQLKEKAKIRPEKQIARRLPAGSGVLAAVPKGKDYASAKRGKKTVDIAAYCQAVRGATETFKDSHRATSTASEHDTYMRLINCWSERSGFGTFVVSREDATEPPMVRAALDKKTGLPMVLKPEMIVGLLLEMATGDENMPKGGHPDDIVRLAAIDDKNPMGPREAWTRKRGEYGYGAYGNEPWSLQAMEKRIYAMRDFYKRELKGTNMDDPASDPLVSGTLAALVLLIGRKAMHVPKVRASQRR